MYGQRHAYCGTCDHVVRFGHPQCSGCGAGWGDLMAYDTAYDRGMIMGGVGFDPLDGQFAFNIPGTDLAIEPDGQVDFNVDGFDFPI